MEAETTTRAKNQGKWGSACASCASAKAKCLRSNDTPGAPCDRCQRLLKECTNQVHRPRKKRVSGKPSKTAQLEERLNGLVDLLRATGELPTNDAHSAGHESRQSAETDSSLGHHEFSPQPEVSQRPSPDSYSGPSKSFISVPKTYNSYAPPRCICRAELGEAPAQMESDESLLAIYQHQLSPRFPFVIIPRTTSPAMLQSSRPFLFSCIKMVASFGNMRSMRAQMYEIMQRISDHMLMRSERSLDLLQGIVVVLGWHQNHCMIHAQQTNLISLATGLLADMGLNRQPEVQERTNILVLDPIQPPPRTNEERRAILGVWFLSSSISVGFQKTDPMKFSAYIQQCLRELEAANECESDRLLAHLVRIQHLTQQIHEMNSGFDELADLPGIPKAPAAAYQRVFQGELDRIRSSLTEDLRTNDLIVCALQAANLHLYEPPVIDASLLKKLSNNLITLNPNSPSALDMFYRAHAALRSFYDDWFSIPITSYLYLPLTVCMQLIHAITMLSRWAKLIGPGRSAPLRVLPPQKPLFDPSSAVPIGVAAYGVGLAPPPDFTSEPTTMQSTEQSRPHSGHGSRGTIQDHHIRDAADPSLSAAIATLKAKLLAQPDLALDIIGILGQIYERFEQVNQETSEAAGSAWQSTIWDLGARKVLITRAKLERWAEIIASGGSVTSPTEQRNNSRVGEVDRNYGNTRELLPADSMGGVMEGVEPTDGRANLMGQPGVAPGGQATTDSPSRVPGSAEGWQYNTGWSNDLFDQIDPSLWFDDAGDWGTLAMQSAGNSY